MAVHPVGRHVELPRYFLCGEIAAFERAQSLAVLTKLVDVASKRVSRLINIHGDTFRLFVRSQIAMRTLRTDGG